MQCLAFSTFSRTVSSALVNKLMKLILYLEVKKIKEPFANISIIRTCN